MIKKKKEDFLFTEGAGRPYEIHPQTQEPYDTTERQKPLIIHLGELNKQGKSPVNYHPKRGRTLSTFTKLKDDEYDDDVEEAFDIE